jgi:hypothetical protein
LVILLINFFQYKKIFSCILDKIYILFGLIISLKAFYFLYIIFLIPLFFYILKKVKLRNTIKLVFLSRRSAFLILMIILVISKYLLNTGCLLYPLYFTCFENLDWSINKNQVLQMNNWYELWSKAGANPNWRIEEPELYIKDFNWVNNWVKSYFFNKVSDFILSLILLVFVVYIFFFTLIKQSKIHLGLSKDDTINKENMYIKILYIILIILFLEWFYNHPSLRYGGYCIIALLLFIPFSLHLIKFKLNLHRLRNTALTIFFISIIIFEGRNINRIKNEIKKYGYEPINETFYKIDENYFKIQKIIQNKKNSKGFF